MAENREDERAASGEDSLRDGGCPWLMARKRLPRRGQPERLRAPRPGSLRFPLRRRRRCISSADRKRVTEIQAPR